MTRRRVRMVGLVCALAGALCLFAGVPLTLSSQPGSLGIIGMGSTLAGISWVCLASIRRPKAARRPPEKRRGLSNKMVRCWTILRERRRNSA